MDGKFRPTLQAKERLAERGVSRGEAVDALLRGARFRQGSKLPIGEEGELHWGKAPYAYAGVTYGTYDAETCDRCGEAFLSEAASDAIDAKAKELGHWGIAKRSKVSTSGHSMMVRIPKELERGLGIAKGDAVVIRPEGRHRLVLDFEGSGTEA